MSQRKTENRAVGQQMAMVAEPEWTERALAIIERLAALHVPFTSEEVTVSIGLPTRAVKQNRNNAVGAVMQHASRKGIIHKTGEYQRAKRAASRGAVLAVWKGGER